MANTMPKRASSRLRPVIAGRSLRDPHGSIRDDTILWRFRDLFRGGGAQPPQGVLGVKPSDLEDSVAAHEQATAVAEMVAVQMLLEEIPAGIGRRAIVEHMVSQVDEARQGVAAGPFALVAMGRKRGDLAGDLLGVPQVVGVEIGDVRRR
jgi:hypothetical protein